jgi:hypothetical protein
MHKKHIIEKIKVRMGTEEKEFNMNEDSVELFFLVQVYPASLGIYIPKEFSREFGGKKNNNHLKDSYWETYESQLMDFMDELDSSIEYDKEKYFLTYSTHDGLSVELAKIQW